FPPVERVYLFMHIDICPIVTGQFDGSWRYYSAKPRLTIIEPIQRIAHLLPQLQIPRPRTKPLPIITLCKSTSTLHLQYFTQTTHLVCTSNQRTVHSSRSRDSSLLPVERQTIS